MQKESLVIFELVMTSVTKLAYLLNNDKQHADDVIGYFREIFEEYIDDIGEEAFCDEYNEGLLGYSLTGLIHDSGIGNTLSVDWKDSESAVDWLESALENEGIKVSIDYGVGDPRSELNVPKIFARGNLQLNTIGYHLLGFDTGADCYTEILLPSELVPKFIQLTEEVGVDIDFNNMEE